ncbi:MAG: condensation domain-containing protein, partial [Gammaproteobacteria bacterium]
MEKLPLNENGKVDRKALPVPAETFERGGYVPPQGPREQCLAAVWREVLGGPEVGLHDNYFERGGDSITAIQVVSRLRRRGWRLRVADVFRHPTIAQLAPCLVEDGQGAEEAEDADRAADIPLTAVQRWFFEHYRGERHHFNQAVLLKSAEALDEGRLRRALGELLRRHDALRLRFVGEGEAVRQSRVPAGEPADLAVIDLRASGDPAAELEHHADQMQAGLDLERGPLLKAGLFRGADGERLLLVIHHLAVDAVSWRILLEELETAYRGDADGNSIELGPKTCSFRRWAEAMRKSAESPE